MAKSRKNTLVWGTDPEFFVGKTNKKGEVYVVPPVEFRMKYDVPFVPNGTHPIFLNNTDRGVSVIEDGVAFELTVRPSTKWEDLFDSVQFGIQMVKDNFTTPFAGIVDESPHILPTINFNTKKYSREKEEYRNCLIFGCDRDYDACNNNAPGKEIDAMAHPLRYGGGHIHISGSKEIKEEPILAIQYLIMSLGLAAVGYSSVPELDRKRTGLYGKPGKYRPQEYASLYDSIPNTDFGVEYRTPSNSWTRSKEHAKKVFEWAEIGIRNLLQDGLGKELMPLYYEESKRSIVECDQTTALHILSEIERKI